MYKVLTVKTGISCLHLERGLKQAIVYTIMNEI